MSRSGSGRKQVISWMDAPDDYYFRPTETNKWVSLLHIIPYPSLLLLSCFVDDHAEPYPSPSSDDWRESHGGKQRCQTACPTTAHPPANRWWFWTDPCKKQLHYRHRSCISQRNSQSNITATAWRHCSIKELTENWDEIPTKQQQVSLIQLWITWNN